MRVPTFAPAPTLAPALALTLAGVLGCSAQSPPESAGPFTHHRLDVGATTSDALALDTDGDGRPEALFAAEGEVIVVEYAGDGAFRVRERVAAGEAPAELAAGDLDGDGWTDLVVANHDTDYLTLLFGTATGFADGRREQIPAGVSPHPHAVLLRDLDGDGRPDLIVDDRDGNGLARFRGRGDGTFDADGHIPVGGDPYRGMVVIDLDGDGDLDVVTPNPRTVAIQWGDGAGGFAPGPELSAPGVTPFGVAVADINGDGMLDVGAAGGEGQATFAVWLATTGGGFELAPGSPWRVPAGPGTVDVGDTDGDGVDEFLLSSWSGAALTMVSAPDGQQRVVPIELGGNPWGAAAADFDGDGRMDLAVANSGRSEVSFLVGGGG